MSRSRKKPYVKDKSGKKTNWYNKIFRRINKQRIHQFKDPKQQNEVVNQYDVCDYNFYCDNDKRYERK